MGKLGAAAGANKKNEEQGGEKRFHNCFVYPKIRAGLRPFFFQLVFALDERVSAYLRVMKIDRTLLARAGDACELSGATENLTTYEVGPNATNELDKTIVLSQSLKEQLVGEAEVTPNDWRCLNDSMWSEVEAVKVVAYRMLHQLRGEGWPQDLLDMMYLEDGTLAWAKAGLPDEDALVHKDSNGNVLEAGDTVVLIKDLKVKGANFTAKRGTAVRNIRLVHDNAGHIEGRVETQQIVILTEYVKKSK